MERKIWITGPGDTFENAAKQLGESVATLRRCNRRFDGYSTLPSGELLLVCEEDPAFDETVELTNELRTMKPEEQQFLFENWALTQTVYEEMAGIGDSFLQNITIQPRQLASALGIGYAAKTYGPTTLRWAGVATDYVESVGHALGSIASKRLGTMTSPFAFRTLEGELRRGFLRKVSYIAKRDGALSLVPAGSRAFQFGGKVLLAPSELGKVRSMAGRVRAVKGLAKALSTTGATVAMGAIDVGVVALEVSEKWDTPEVGVTFASETTGLAGKMMVGSWALANSEVWCLALAPAGGWPAAACIVIVGVAGMAAGSYVGRRMGASGYQAIEQLTPPKAFP